MVWQQFWVSGPAFPSSVVSVVNAIGIDYCCTFMTTSFLLPKGTTKFIWKQVKSMAITSLASEIMHKIGNQNSFQEKLTASRFLVVIFCVVGYSNKQIFDVNQGNQVVLIFGKEMHSRLPSPNIHYVYTK